MDEEFGMLKWLSEHKFQAHTTAFLLMVIASIGMLFSIQQDQVGLSWLWVMLFASANLLAMLIK
jgi:hypothetical protein